MRTNARVLTALVAGGVFVAGTNSSFADELITDSDALVTGTQHAITLSATPGQTLTFPVGLYIQCATKSHMAGSTTVSYSTGSTVPTGGALSATGVTLAKPANWPIDGINCASPTPQTTSVANSTATLTAPTADGSYTYQLRYTASDNDVNHTGNNAKVAVTLNVATPQPTDPTPPVITRTITGTAGTNGWYRSNVSVVWSVSDPDSQVTSTTGCGVQAFSSNAAAETASCSATSAGGTSSQSVALKIDKDAPTVTGTLSTTGKNAAGWYRDDVAVNWSYSDVGPSGLVGSYPATTTVSGEGRARTSTVSNVTDAAGNVASGTSAGVNIDRNGPQVSSEASSVIAYTDGAGVKWYKDSAAFTWSATDPALADTTLGSGVKDGSLTPVSKTFGEGFGQASTASASDNADNPGSGSISGVNVDASAPAVSAAITSTPAYTPSPDTKWFKDSVSIAVEASDPNVGENQAGSGLKTDPSTTTAAPVVRTASGSFSATAEDNVGHTTTSNTVNFLVDSAAPSVTPSCPTAPVIKGASGSASWTASDETGGSGLATTSTGTIALDTSSVGTKTATVPAGTARDNVGHGSAAASCSYSVIYDWTGFFQPIDNLDATGAYVLNSVKAGSAIPAKFKLGGDQGLGVLAAGYPMIGDVTCTANTTDAIEELSTATTSGLKYDATAGQYIYNWKTDSTLAGKCKQLILKLDDGTTHRANFKFTK